VFVTITPAEVTLLPGTPQHFSADVIGTSNEKVTWNVEELDGGSIDTTGRYVAPKTQGTFHVVATSVVDPDPTKKARATVNVVRIDKAIIDTPPIELQSGPGPVLGPAVLREAEATPSPSGNPTTGRAFIHPEERPEVGTDTLQGHGP
jgi:hypothetical protein